MQAPRRNLAVRSAAALLLCVAPSAAQGVGQVPLESGLVESSRVDVVQDWPVLVLPLRPKHAEHCATIGPEGLKIEEQGQEVRILAVDRAGPVTTNVLMLDTSASMTDPWRATTRKRARQTKAAAAAFVEWMRADASPAPGGDDDRERLMVVSFDDDLLLRGPPSVIDTDAAALELKRSIHAMTGGYYTALNDSLFRLSAYLGGARGRAVVILLSDGADRSSVRNGALVLEAVETMDSLTVFPIGIGLDAGPHQDFLEQVALAGGGHYYWLRDRSASRLSRPLQKKFRDIRQRLKSQVYVSYLAEPFGAVEGEPERTDDRGRVRRHVRIVSRDRRCEVPRGGYRPTRTVRSPRSLAATGGSRDQPTLWIDRDEDGTTRLGIQLDDLARDANPLIRYDDEYPGAKFRRREIEIEVPPFDRRFDAGKLEHVLHRWLLRDVLPPRMDLGLLPTRRQTGYPVAGELNGKTFLDQRDALARVVFDEVPEYRAWALGRVEERLRLELADRFPAADTGAADRRRLVDATIADRLERVLPEDYAPFLADWLTDVPARRLALALETLEARRQLAAGESGDAQADRVQREWPRLRGWLPLPDRVRVTTPLVLACDASRQTCGYHRIVLPRLSELPESTETLRGKLEIANLLVPLRPWGLMTVRWMLGLSESPDGTREAIAPGQSRLADELRTRWSVEGIRHRHLIPGASPKLDEMTLPLCDIEVLLDLTDRPGDASPSREATLAIQVDGGAEPDTGEVRCAGYRPLCYDLAGDRGSLEAALAASGLERCTEEPTP